MIPEVDVVVLNRTDTCLPLAVLSSIKHQRGVRPVVHQVVGQKRSTDVCRWQTIARARNEGKTRGQSPWLMFLDDDVVLGPDAASRLLRALTNWPSFGAVAADYLLESGGHIHCEHVAMGATLFRRSALDRIQFRWTDRDCECKCCGNDLRAFGYKIGYVPTVAAEHLRGMPAESKVQSPVRPDRAIPVGGRTHGCVARDVQSRQDSLETESVEPRILTAFDANLFASFVHVFLASLRSFEPNQALTVLGYGLSSRQQQFLARQHQIELIHFPDNGITPCLRRLRGFESALRRWNPNTPVAHWDAGDVKFQARLQPLWELVRRNPKALLAAHEPISHPENRAVAAWTRSIVNPFFRRRAYELLASNPFLNAGFAAGTAAVMLDYCRDAQKLRAEGVLQGSTDWGDQTTFNMYCHLNPTKWMRVDSGWNFCLCHRHLGQDYNVLGPDRQGRFVVTDLAGKTIPVVHGNAGSMNHLVSRLGR